MLFLNTHTIPEWGESFRPACLELGRILPELDVGQITAFTATASPLILEKIKSILFDGLSFNLVRANPDRVNIHYQVRPVLSRMRTLTELLPEIERPALIFCSTRRQTEQCALTLRQRLGDEDIRFYHAGLSKELRSELENWYFDSDRAVLAATCAYGMGMDKSNIRTVIHYALPSSVEAYLQESGRAGRDRRPCRAILLYHPEDRKREEKNPNAELRSRYEKLLAFAEDSKTCRRQSLLAILEAEPEDCDSCDVCCDQVLSKDPEQDHLTALVKRYETRFPPALLQDFLLGRHSRPIRQGLFHRSWGFGSLKDWDPNDVKELIRGAVTRGALRIKDKGIRKGCLR
jgi:ATP-dependent DNA helicase RecQ